MSERTFQVDQVSEQVRHDDVEAFHGGEPTPYSEMDHDQLIDVIDRLEDELASKGRALADLRSMALDMNKAYAKRGEVADRYFNCNKLDGEDSEVFTNRLEEARAAHISETAAFVQKARNSILFVMRKTA